MPKLNARDVPWGSFTSPKGAYRCAFKELSVALGAKRDAPLGSGGHPFDLALEKLAPGEKCCPYHSHAAQWEMFFILSGTGTVRVNGESFPIGPHDVILHPPGEAHQITNTSSEELLYLIIADNPPLDICHYPDSDKWGMYGDNLRRVFRPADIDYFEGEE